MHVKTVAWLNYGQAESILSFLSIEIPGNNLM